MSGTNIQSKAIQPSALPDLSSEAVTPPSDTSPQTKNSLDTTLSDPASAPFNATGKKGAVHKSAEHKGAPHKGALHGGAQVMSALAVFGESRHDHPVEVRKKFDLKKVQILNDQTLFNVTASGIEMDVGLQDRAIRDTSSGLPDLGTVVVRNSTWDGPRKFTFDRNDTEILKKVLAAVHR